MIALARNPFFLVLVGLFCLLGCEEDDNNDTVNQPDTTPPGAVTTLAAGTPTQNSVPLSWTAVGDDATTGTAAGYDLRYATATITSGNWDSATLVTSEPTPKAAGGTESFTVTGLTAETTYYFALKVGDEASNWSALSNVVSATTAAGGTSADYEASGTIATNEEGTVTTNSGASIHVPLYAVPEAEAGGAGQMVFSIERDESTAATPPTGTDVASDVYRFGPDGFTFDEMVEVTLPVTGDVSGKNVALYRIDQTSGESESYGGEYDSVSNTIKAQTYHLSPWYVGSYDPTATAYGAFKVINNSTTDWLYLCVEEYDLDYPDADANFDGDAWSMWAPVGHIGWASTGNWYLPQGTYRLCVSMSRAGTVLSPPGTPRHGYVDNAQIHEPWTRWEPNTTTLSFSQAPSPSIEGECECTPEPTSSVGTGDVQVTLTWHSAQAIDLDLWVTEPNGETCKWSHTVTSTGGRLDRDNLCGNYINGRPENIFWENAPVGEYSVSVNLYYDCGNGISSQAFDVRIVTGSSTRTYTGTVTSSTPTVTVATFTITSALAHPQVYGQGASVSFSDYLGTPIDAGPMPPKQ